MPWQSWLETRMDTTTFPILPKTPFKGDTPHLQSFSIDRCTVDFTLPIFRNSMRSISTRTRLHLWQGASSVGVENLQRHWDDFSGTLRKATLDYLSVLDCRASILVCSPPLLKYTLSCPWTGFAPHLTTLLNYQQGAFSSATTHLRGRYSPFRKLRFGFAMYAVVHAVQISPSSSPGILTSISFRS